MESSNRSGITYEPLLTESEKDSEDEMPAYGKKQRSQWWRHWAFSLLLLIAYSLALLELPHLWTRPSLDPFLTYTPAKEAISYHKHKFDGSLGLRTKYTGEPRPEVEEAWGHLFQHYNLRFTAEEMEKLNRTQANPIELRNGGGFFGQLSAYHHLHCLKMLRLVLWHDLYNISIPDLRGHADHCIDDIRQSLMCHADLSVVTFWWHPEMRKPMPNFHLDQTCVNWDRLDAWASKRSFSIFDQKTLVHPKLGLSFPMVDGEIQVHGGHNHGHKVDHAHDLPPVWPEDDDHKHKDHSEHWQ
ncbi:hypothetical protein B0H67DRAFT_549984 [Lasiosphaeris hirsuta]|uniref:Uncharacterized protein n=1 Tax=Lasiosphaeris hirsuta TaxID=260670 RepID=A0AA40AY63_9PEZI|nr:hypothetical protein B0H67DRAFT_549984 [Lasiosphaeris hirsuta]